MALTKQAAKNIVALEIAHVVKADLKPFTPEEEKRNAAFLKQANDIRAKIKVADQKVKALKKSDPGSIKLYNAMDELILIQRQLLQMGLRK